MKANTRREFLALSGSLCAGAAAATALRPVPAWANSISLRLGIQLYAVRGVIEADTPGTLKAIYDIGYREVETAGFGKYSAKDFGQIIRNAGLSCPSAHLQMDVLNIDSVFEDAHALGVACVTSSLLRPGRSGPGAAPVGVAPSAPLPASLNDFKGLAARMNDIGTRARAARLQYAYHNHAHEFLRMPDGSFGYDVLLSETDPELVKFEIDCGWMSVSGASPAGYMKKYPTRIRMLHIKDFKSIPAAGEHPIGCELGTGFIDYRPIFAAAKAIGIQHVFAEQEGPYTKPEMESARIDYAYLHSASQGG